MTIFGFELKRNRISLIIWCAVIASMIAISILLFPLMEKTMTEMTELLANMGGLSAAYGMDQLSIGDYLNYYAMECSEILGLGGGLFAALTAIAALSKEEREHTAEFLLTHPVSRTRVVTEKLLAVLLQVALLNAAVAAVTVICTIIIGQHPDAAKLALVLLAYFLLHIEIACVSFCISAFTKGRGVGIGIGLVLLAYFLNIIANITDKAKALRWITPFAYTDSTYIIKNTAVDMRYLAIGVAVSVICVIAAYLKYNKKDIT
ncbi:MAG: ABC transporter permease subunit [Clostridia bacterium]|nr:ABC transporter permease subunit [Clostridia bacterium]